MRTKDKICDNSIILFTHMRHVSSTIINNNLQHIFYTYCIVHGNLNESREFDGT